MPINPPVIPGFPWNRSYSPAVQPFTYQDGATYLKILAALEAYVVQVVDELNKHVGEFEAETVERLNDAVDAVQQALNTQADLVNATLAAQVEQVEGQLTAQDTKFDALETQLRQDIADAVNQVINTAIEVNDSIVEGIVLDEGSATRRALDALYQAIGASLDADIKAVLDASPLSETRQRLDELYASPEVDVPTNETVASWVRETGPTNSAIGVIVQANYRPNRERDTVFNARDFGMATNATGAVNVAALNAALAAAGPVGGLVIIPRGTYRTAGHIELQANVELDGKGSTLLRSAAGLMFRNWELGDNTTTGYSGRSNIYIHDLIMDANANEQPGPLNILTFDHCENIVVERCTFRNTVGYHALEFNAVRNAVARDCLFEGWLRVASLGDREAIQIDCATSAIDSGAADGTMTTSVTIDSCIFRGRGSLPAHSTAVGSHSYVGTYQKIVVRDCHIVNGVRAIDGYYWNNSQIINNRIEGVTTNGIRLRNSGTSIISGNTITGTNITHAISNTSECTNCIISDNTIYNANDGIYVGGGSYGTNVHHNSVLNSNKYSIVTENSDAVRLDGNTLGGAGTASGGAAGAIRVGENATRCTVIGNMYRGTSSSSVTAGASVAATATGCVLVANQFLGVPTIVTGTVKLNANNTN